MTFLSHLDWRFAAKSFDPSSKVSEEHLQKIKDSIRMAPTSFGLQPFEVKIITDPNLLEELKPHAWNQEQITSCSHLLVFCARTDVQTLIDRYFIEASGGSPEIREKMKGYEDMMHGALDSRAEADILLWAQKQVYIALGFAMAACAELKVDSCPMEGFVSEEFDTLLNLPRNLRSTVLLPIGSRTENPSRTKVRVGEEEMFR